MADKTGFTVTFWGVRGSLATAGPGTVRYGGNTSCVEIRCDGELIIFDAGTGLRTLGLALDGNGPVDADLFFSHTHLDHVVGLPFFAPLFQPENNVRMWAGHLQPEHDLQEVICSMMRAPLFPVPPDMFGAEPHYNDFLCGETLTPKPGVTIKTAPLNHPDRATAYRVEFEGKSVCYVTDTEHDPSGLDENILGLIRGADLFIYDSTYTDEEYPSYKGWGHSTWQEGVRLSDAAGVKTLVLFHHDPSHDDVFMDGVAAAAEQMRPGTIVAREGLSLDP
ncbi:MAG: MBL fold metallo-hydrolase [Alphaproteobacteria bacterium]|nr:MBL fold metallo-hydrolase [Alphaproteobacteria bacterium]